MVAEEFGLAIELTEEMRPHRAEGRQGRVRERQFALCRVVSLSENQVVEFEIEQGQKGPQATNAKPASDASEARGGSEWQLYANGELTHHRRGVTLPNAY